MLAPFARRPLTQSPRFVRSLAALPRVPSSRFATPRFSSTAESDSTSTIESGLKSAETALNDATELYDQHDVLSKRFEEIVKVVDEVKSLSNEAKPSSFTSYTRSKPFFSQGSDVAKLSAEYKLLTTENAWKLTTAGTGLYKTFFFKTYSRGLDFIQIVGINSKAKSHHPHISFRPPNSVKIHWTTHSPPGLSEKDFHMAKICDENANLLGGSIEPIRPVTPKTQREETPSVVRKIAVPGS
ncbi:uncharacterized protein TRUGW13939_11603 [Talaromyces rugulosus]|uniref:4a-hydroxytetrahydrobiopterin dehydratase n=1 Tax=Talaromyces rugulosus TaxID=121627 RepID=A0A7H8RD87_TALRU|nr:uncharacterized protein TRUGW13939_11603 [Talaromyces rugulosus]QKX64429.1 hypothetical protein TRUGW13939_11603 [Talaromyces rugulosus]